VADVMIALIPIPAPTVISSVHIVERTERSFVHSEATMPRRP
jgi:hypothetical protein